MTDLINRQTAIDALLEKGQKSRRYKLGEIWELNFDEIREALATVPSTQPKKGKWIEKSIGGEHFDFCSECGYVEGDAPNNYCPYCGADMRGEE
ncbi:MAG: hypothetical protein IKE28_11990 [Solobacterium sp.]|nr:hypothetical protein [Solobacterium sp.]